ncbi:MAG: type 1 glutamine amidotransferase [Proteobacteria bacterium]|nr:MAG: type 1 glutamine amidotransferase [Pseudomonadota bacterium]
MKVLVLDNNRDPEWFGASDLTTHVASAGPVEVHVRRGPECDFPKLEFFDAIVISGSKTSCRSSEPWVDEFDRYLKSGMDLKIPMLGVCFGHQSIARVLGGRDVLGRAQIPEIGWTRIEVLKNDPLFEGLGSEFYTYSSHYEEISKLPPQMENFARSKDCANQATRIPELGIYTVQFHPERSLAQGDQSIQTRYQAGERAGILGRGEGKIQSVSFSKLVS